jgi:superfamily II DNA/RNA helicase
MNFLQLPLHEKIQASLKELGFESPTEIQETAIPKVLEGLDIRGCAKTGTGKTAAFLLPALQRFAESKEKKAGMPKVLILVPTRELGQQIEVELKRFSKHLKHLHHVNIGGGVPLHAQMRELQKPHTFLIATPGRLLDFLSRKKVSLKEVEMLILDEADRMLDMGFVEPVHEIVSHMPEQRQTLLFTATLHKRIIKLSEELMKPNPFDVIVSEESGLKQENIKQKLYYTSNLKHKSQILDTMLQQEEHDQVIIFTSTKRYADQLSTELKEKGYRSAALHGDMYQKKRTLTLSKLRKGDIKILVATDVAARGIDVQTVTHVVNFDLPQSVEDYVHRIGRTGRAGREGTALSFAAHQERSLVKRIEKYTGRKMDLDGPDSSEEESSSAPRKRGRFGDKRSSSYGGRRSSSSAGEKRSSFGEKRSSSFGEKRPSFGEKRSSSFGDKRSSSFGEKRPSFGEKRSSSFGDKRSSSFGEKRPSFKKNRDQFSSPKRSNFKRSPGSQSRA